MTMVHYTVRVEENGSLNLPKEAQEALNLQPGDEIRIQVEAESMEQEREELRHALDIGLEQLGGGDYSVYSADTIQELVKEVRAEGQKCLDQTREEVEEQLQHFPKEQRFRLIPMPPLDVQNEDNGPTLTERFAGRVGRRSFEPVDLSEHAKQYFRTGGNDIHG